MKTGIQHEVQVFTIYSHIHTAIKQTIVLKVNKTASDHVDYFFQCSETCEILFFCIMGHQKFIVCNSEVTEA